MQTVIEILAVLVVGPMVGSEFAVAAFVHPIVGRLSDDAFGAARGDSSRVLGKVMPFWYLGSLVLLVATAVVTRSFPIGLAAALMAVVVVLTVTVMVPINNRLAARPATGEPPRALAGRWDRWHWLRVALLAVSLLLLVIGVCC